MPNNAYDRYVTWAMEVPEGVAVPYIDPWSLLVNPDPIIFPDPSGPFFPRNVVPMYAIRTPVDVQATSPDDTIPYTIPAGYWILLTNPNNYYFVSDDYFFGDIPDLSGGTEYPADAIPPTPPADPPPWVGDPNPPGTDTPQATT